MFVKDWLSREKSCSYVFATWIDSYFIQAGAGGFDFSFFRRLA